VIVESLSACYKKPHVVLGLAATQEAQTNRILPFFHIMMTHILLCYSINIFPVLRIHIIKVDKRVEGNGGCTQGEDRKGGVSRVSQLGIISLV
jgi:hypothetical protein